MRNKQYHVKGKYIGKMHAGDLSAFTQQLATMQRAGIPLVKTLQTIIDSKSKYSKLAVALKKHLEHGHTLAATLRMHPQVFDNLYCNLIEAGEESGSLDLMLDRIAVYLEKTTAIKRKLKKAMYYPIAVIATAVIVILILLIKVVPTFKAIFAQFNTELPSYTQFVLGILETLQQHWLKFLISAIALLAINIKLYRSSHAYKSLVQRGFLRLPFLGKTLHKIALAAFTRTFATTFGAGLPLPKILLLCAKTSNNLVYYHAIMRIREQIAHGHPINVAMRQTNLFPPLMIQMVAIGEQSGSLENMLLKVTELYSAEVDLAIDGLTTLLEPVIMLFLGLIVGGLVIAMYLPIFNLGSVF